MLLEIHVQAVRKKMSQMLVFRFQAVMRSEIKVAKVMMSHCQEKLLALIILYPYRKPTQVVEWRTLR